MPSSREEEILKKIKEEKKTIEDLRKRVEEVKKDIDEDRDTTKGSESMYEDECIDLLRELSKLTSESSSLKFELYQLNETARIETMRLAALISECEFYDKEKALFLRKEMEPYFKKYRRSILEMPTYYTLFLVGIIISLFSFKIIRKVIIRLETAAINFYIKNFSIQGDIEKF